jgi:hypothetical protein
MQMQGKIAATIELPNLQPRRTKPYPLKPHAYRQRMKRMNGIVPSK